MGIHFRFLHVKELSEHLYVLAYGNIYIYAAYIRVHVQCFITVVLVCTLLFIHAKEVSKSSLVEYDTSQNAMHLNLLCVRAVTICSNLCTKMADNTTRWLTVLITPRRDVVKSRDTIKYSKHCWCETSHGHAYCLAQ